MDARIAVDPTLPPARLPGRLLNEICAHARETFPEECCGLLTGDAAQPFRGVHRCRNDMARLHRSDPDRYPRDAKNAFHMNETDYLKVLEQAEARGERVSAVYHSHAGAGAYFSELDQEFAGQELFPFPEAEHLVISVVDRTVKEVASFRWSAVRGGFEGRAVQAEAQ